MTPLPRLMVAPNGARRDKSDHPAIPITDDEMVQTARACQIAGADGIHVHIRDDAGVHLLDADRYAVLLERLEREVPGLYLQVTSEGAGLYSAQEQRDIMRALKPAHVSVSLREMVRQPSDWPDATAFYHWSDANNVEIQHILFTPHEINWFVEALSQDLIPGTHHLIQLVQGTYEDGNVGAIALGDYLAELHRAKGHSFDWMLCAFGDCETEQLIAAAKMGGKARAGFENSLWNKDGSLAKYNAERIAEVDSELLKAVAKG